jgi:hypothetical protein
MTCFLESPGTPGAFFSLFAPPALGKGRHSILARRSVTGRRRPVLVIPEGERPHSWLACRRGGGIHDAAEHDAVGEHVVVVLVPLAGWAAHPDLQTIGRRVRAQRATCRP